MTGITTELTELFDLEVPIVQAPIGSATCPELASAVANAGGLETLALPETTGDVEALPLYAGQSAGLIDTSPSASAVIKELATETNDTLERTASFGARSLDTR